MSGTTGISGALLLGLHLIVLHRSDGGEVTINAEQITSLRSPVGHLGRLAPLGRCIVGLTDHKFVSVLETCDAITRQLEAEDRSWSGK